MPESPFHAQNWNGIEFDNEKYGTAFGRYLYDLEAATFSSMLAGVHGRILDVGGGTGKLTVSLGHESRWVVSIDSSLDMIKVARRKTADKKEGMPTFVICDAQRLCFQDNIFDAIVSSRVLMHLPDWREGISECCRVARGEVVMDFPPLRSFSGLNSIFRRFMSLFITDVKTHGAFSTRTVIREFQQHEFQIVSEDKHFFLPYAFHRWLDIPRVSVRIETLCRKLGLVTLLGASVTLKARKLRHYDSSAKGATT